MGARPRASAELRATATATILQYRLGDAAAQSRARVAAALETTTTLAPLALVLVLLQRLGYAGAPFVLVSAALAGLSALRGVLAYRRLVRRLRHFEVTVSEDALTVETRTARFTAPRARIARIVELPGRFGGLRLIISKLTISPKDADVQPNRDEVPERVDIPRGGERFGDVRAALEGWCAITRARRLGRVVWVAIVGLVVGGVFFLPFFFEAALAGRSRLVAIALVLGLWFVLRFVIRRR